MKILIIHSHYLYQGGEDIVFRQDLELLQQTNEVEVLVFRNLPGWRGALQFLLSIWNIQAAAKIKKAILLFHPDIIHIHNWHFGFGPLAIRAAKNRRVPLVHTLHNYRLICPSATLLYKGSLFTNSIRASFPWDAIRKGVYRNSTLQTFWLALIIWVHKKLGTWKMVDRYIVLTEFARQLFIKSSIGLPSGKYVVKPNFIYRRKFEPMNRSDYFLYVGRLSEEKGIQVLCEAFKQSPYELRIAGDGPLKEMVAKVCSERQNITYLGTLGKESVEDALQQCSALIFPSICYEGGLALTILEAFSLSTPVIASNIGTMAYSIRNGYNGILFEAGDVASLVTQLDTWQSFSGPVKDVYRKNAFETYNESYTPELIKKKLEEIYTELLMEKKAI